MLTPLPTYACDSALVPSYESVGNLSIVSTGTFLIEGADPNPESGTFDERHHSALALLFHTNLTYLLPLLIFYNPY